MRRMPAAELCVVLEGGSGSSRGRKVGSGRRYADLLLPRTLPDGLPTRLADGHHIRGDAFHAIHRPGACAGGPRRPLTAGA